MLIRPGAARSTATFALAVVPRFLDRLLLVLSMRIISQVPPRMPGR